MKPNPLNYAVRSMAFVGLVSTYTIVGAALCAASCAGLASAMLKREAK